MSEGGRLKTRRRVQGIVSSDRMSKTIVVKQDRLERHPLYGKFVRRTTKYYAHDESNEAREGDHVEIVASNPRSKLKRWALLRVMKRRIEETTPPAKESAQEGEEGAS